MRGVVRRSELRRIGLPLEALPPGAVPSGDWVVDADRARELRGELEELVRTAEHGSISTAAAAHALGLPDAGLAGALVMPPLRQSGGEIRVDQDVPAEWAAALEELRASLVSDPFAAPEAGRLRDLGLDVAAQARLHRDGHLLRLSENVVLLPGSDELAVDRLRALAQPFTTSQARQCLGTTRRVVLPLLAHLDRLRRTVRLPDDTRRLV
jgi:selenocysteine-specific elongation factor